MVDSKAERKKKIENKTEKTVKFAKIKTFYGITFGSEYLTKNQKFKLFLGEFHFNDFRKNEAFQVF